MKLLAWFSLVSFSWFSSALVFPEHAWGSYLVGNGGGSWVCRDGDDGELRWAQLVDVFEARAQGPIEEHEGEDEEAILASFEKRLGSIDPWLRKAFSIRLARVREQWVPVSGMQLEVLDDALYYGRPAPEVCPIGNVAYEQVVNFFPDGRIFADMRIFEALAPLDRAALFAHEALYLLFREIFGDTNSLRARKAVSLLLAKAGRRELELGFDWYRPKGYVLVAEPRFDEIGAFSEGLAPARMGARWGFVGPTTAWTIPLRFDDARSFSERRAAVRMGGLWGYVSPSGRFSVKPRFEDALGFRGGLAPVKTEGLWGAIDARGREVLPSQFAFLTEFSKEGIAVAATTSDRERNVLRVVDSTGRTLAAIPGSDARPFREGKAAVFNEGRWRFIDGEGRDLPLGPFVSTGDFRAGKALVSFDDGSVALVDVRGAELRRTRSERLLLGTDGALVACGASCVLDLTREAFPAGDSLVTGFEEGYAVFRRGDRWGLYARVP